MKTKRKREPDIKIVATLPLEMCVERIQAVAVNKSPWFALHCEKVKIHEINEWTYEYEIRQWKYGNFVTHTKGTLISRDENTTYITGNTKIHIYFYFFYVVMILSGITILLSMLINGNLGGFFFLLFWASIGVMNWYRLMRWRDELSNKVIEALKIAPGKVNRIPVNQ